MEYHVTLVGACPQVIEADGPYNAYLKYMKHYNLFDLEDVQIIVSMTEYDEDDENTQFVHNFFFDGDGIIIPEMSLAERFER